MLILFDSWGNKFTKFWEKTVNSLNISSFSFKVFERLNKLTPIGLIGHPLS